MRSVFVIALLFLSAECYGQVCPSCPVEEAAPVAQSGGSAGSYGSYGQSSYGSSGSSYGSTDYAQRMRASRRVARRSGGSAGSYGSAGRSGSWGFPVARLVTAPIRLVNKVRLNSVARRADHRGPDSLPAARTEAALARRGY